MPVKEWALSEFSFPVEDNMLTIQESTVMNTLRKLGNFFLVAAANTGISLVNSLLGRLSLHRDSFDFLPKDIVLSDLNMNPVVDSKDVVENHQKGIIARQETVAQQALSSWIGTTSSWN